MIRSINGRLYADYIRKNLLPGLSVTPEDFGSPVYRYNNETNQLLLRCMFVGLSTQFSLGGPRYRFAVVTKLKMDETMSLYGVFPSENYDENLIPTLKNHILGWIHGYTTSSHQQRCETQVVTKSGRLTKMNLFVGDHRQRVEATKFPENFI